MVMATPLRNIVTIIIIKYSKTRRKNVTVSKKLAGTHYAAEIKSVNYCISESGCEEESSCVRISHLGCK